MLSLRAFCKLKTVYVYILLTIIDRQFHNKMGKELKKLSIADEIVTDCDVTPVTDLDDVVKVLQAG